MSNFSCQQFCDFFDVYIGFDQSGYGQIFKSKPKFIERDNFFLAMEDSKLLPCLVNDYSEWSNKRRMVLFSPGGKDKPEISEKELTKMDCADFKKGDMFAGNVLVKEVFTMPDTINDGDKYIITCRDCAGHDLIWKTKAKNIPNQGDKKFLKAKVVGNTSSTEYGIPAFEITNCSFLKEKKEAAK